jgi:hypothetical protein
LWRQRKTQAISAKKRGTCTGGALKVADATLEADT